MRATAAFAATTAIALAVTGIIVTTGDGPATSPPIGGRHSTTVQAAGVGLAAFDACESMTDELVARATERGAAGLWSWGMYFGEEMMAVGGADGDTAGRSAAPPVPMAAEQTGADVSDTNVQVAGVDEPDLVETDGRRLFTISEGRLTVLDLSRGAPQLLSTVDLPQSGEPQMLLDGDRLLLLGHSWGAVDMPMREGDDAIGMPGFESPKTTLWLYDVATDTPALLAELTVDGSLVSARGVDGTVHAVIAHRPNPIVPMDFGTFTERDGTFDEARANREIAGALSQTTAADWLPTLAHIDARGVVEQRPAVGCTEVRATSETPDTSMLNVMTFDITGADLEPEASTAVLTDATTITATADQLVVATPVMTVPEAAGTGAPAPDEPVTSVAATEEAKPEEVESEEVEPDQLVTDAPVPAPPVAPEVIAPQFTTRLHLFSLAPTGATYLASGEVPGNVLNQFSMDLWNGSLRVATTTENWNTGGSESQVTVLQQRGDRLETVGAVGGLGKGEQIYSVRFVGDRGYVVTFRQVDPLYTLDLADATNPTVQGELKITGYSAYLHPFGEHRIIGVGQEATEEGRRVGVQVSLFDTSDPANPRRLAQVVLPQSDTEAEWDHHAILVHGDTMALPYMRWMEPTADRPEGFESGALVLDVQPEAIALRGTVNPDLGAGNVEPWLAQMRRAVYVDGTLYLVGYRAVTAVDAHTLAPLGTLTF